MAEIEHDHQVILERSQILQRPQSRLPGVAPRPRSADNSRCGPRSRIPTAPESPRWLDTVVVRPGCWSVDGGGSPIRLVAGIR